MHMKHMMMGVSGAAILFSLIGWSNQQPTSRPQPRRDTKFNREAIVEHKAGLVKVSANHPRPLERIVSALNEDYGWAISFEDPPYVSDFELTNNTDPDWQRSNPGARRPRIPAGGVFQREYLENSSTRTKAGEEGLLRRIVTAYNQSGNPGKFTVRFEEDRLEVVPLSVKDSSGIDQDVSPVLDTRITIPAQQRTVFATIAVILKELSSETGIKVSFGTVPMNILTQSEVNLSGNNVLARQLLSQALSGTGRTLTWSMLYDANIPGYFLNLSVAVVATRDTYGRKSLIPIDKLGAR